MEENIKVEKDFLEAFNLGYELAKELNLKTPMFEDLNADNTRLNAMQAGMKKYTHENKLGQDNNIIENKGPGLSL